MSRNAIGLLKANGQIDEYANTSGGGEATAYTFDINDFSVSAQNEVSLNPFVSNAPDNIAPKQTSDTASKLIEVGEYFINKNGDLCQCDVQIASGGTITIGTNCHVVSDGVANGLSNEQFTIESSQNIWVDAINGDDANDGTTEAKAVQTLKRMTQLVQSKVKYNLSIYIKKGTYSWKTSAGVEYMSDIVLSGSSCKAIHSITLTIYPGVTAGALIITSVPIGIINIANNTMGAEDVTVEKIQCMYCARAEVTASNIIATNVSASEGSVYIGFCGAALISISKATSKKPQKLTMGRTPIVRAYVSQDSAPYYTIVPNDSTVIAGPGTPQVPSGSSGQVIVASDGLHTLS